MERLVKLSILSLTMLFAVVLISPRSSATQLDIKALKHKYVDHLMKFRPGHMFTNERDRLHYDWADKQLTQYERNEILYLSNGTEYACLGFYDNLAHASSIFIECAINNSRPFHMCQNCAKTYLEVKQSYNLIIEDKTLYATSLYPQGLHCEDIVEATDRVQMIVRVFDIIDTIWTEANCDSCFETLSYTNGTANISLTKDIDEFYQKQKELEICIFNFTKNQPSMDPLFQNYSSNASLCSACKDHYVNISNLFMHFGDENGFCMDVVDLFNYTRIAWSQGYKCNYRQIDEDNVLIVSGVFALATVIFYVTMRLINQKEAKTYLRINRKSYSNLINS